jgi:hypothetical protein
MPVALAIRHGTMAAITGDFALGAVRKNNVI